MKAVRLHKYHERPSVDEVSEPRVTDPLDVLVRVGAAGLCRTDFAHLRGAVGAADPSRASIHPRPTRMLGGSRRSVRLSPMWPSATP